MKIILFICLLLPVYFCCDRHVHHELSDADRLHGDRLHENDGVPANHSHEHDCMDHSHTHAEQAGMSGHDHGDAAGRISFTRYSDSYELFLEYAAVETGTTSDFLFHVTNLNDFSPLENENTVFHILSENGKIIAVPHLHAIQPGILRAEQQLNERGKLTGRLTIGTGKNEIFTFGIDRKKDIIKSEAKDHGIVYTKEKQWDTDFFVHQAEMRTVHSLISATANVLPRQDGHAQVVAPIAGILNVKHNPVVTAVGRRVKTGDVLAVLCPPLMVQDSWTSRQLAYEQAKSEYERAQRLFEKEAVSKRELERLKREYLVQKDGYDFYMRQGGGETTLADSTDRHYYVRSPISGTVSQVNTVLGQSVNVGDRMFTIIDPSVVWLEVKLHERDFYQLADQVSGVTVHLAGRDPLILSGPAIEMLNSGDVMDSKSRTIPVLLRVVNKNNLLKIGQIVSVDLYTERKHNAVCVPYNAVYHDGTHQVVFVQLEGELFEKRTIKTGDRYQQYVCVSEGLKPGERVVTRGGYLLKLSATQTEIGHGHAH